MSDAASELLLILHSLPPDRARELALQTLEAVFAPDDDRPYAAGDPGPGTVLSSTHVALVNATPGAEVAGRRQWLQRMPAWMLRRLAGGWSWTVPGGLVTLNEHVKVGRCRECVYREEEAAYLAGCSVAVAAEPPSHRHDETECRTCGGVGYVFRGPAWPVFGPWRPGEYEEALRAPGGRDDG